MSRDRSLGEVEWEDQIELAAEAEFYAAGLIRLLVQAIERGDADLGITPSAWDNTMAAVDWALPMHMAGRLQGPAVITVEDVERMRRMRALGGAALAGGAENAELVTIASACVESLLGPDWKRYVLRAEKDARELLQLSPPG